MPEGRLGVAGRLYGLLVQRFGTAPAVTLTAWDGSRAGADESLVIYLRSRQAVRRMLWHPGALGVAQAYVSDQLDVDGDFEQTVAALLDYLEIVAAAGPPTAVDRRETVRVAVVTGAVGPAARAPAVFLDAVDGYAAVDAEIAERLSPALGQKVLGDEWYATARGLTDSAGDGRARTSRHATHPEPLSSLLGRWESAGVLPDEIRRVDADHVRVLRAWSAGLERHWDVVRTAVGAYQARAWRLSLALDREYLERGRVAIYDVEVTGRGG